MDRVDRGKVDGKKADRPSKVADDPMTENSGTIPEDVVVED